MTLVVTGRGPVTRTRVGTLSLGFDTACSKAID